MTFNVVHVTLFDGVCDQTKELQALSNSMSNDVKWIISSSGRYMFVRFAVDKFETSKGFLAKIHYGNEILNKRLVLQRGNNPSHPWSWLAKGQP